MTNKLDFRAFAITLFLVGLVSYVLCIAGDLLFDWTMYQVWAPLLPGFTWPLTPVGFTIGLIWLVLYSLYGAAIIVWPYNLFVRRESA
ncbi:MAG TPA: hypothetical protein VE136_12335 [Anaerolineales bacterium]|jgi:hypothetical protein|nr:hypothetical protein [Anaerolineales bacterium]